MADELKPAYLIAGTDRPKIDRAVARLRARFSADAIEVHSADAVSGEDAVALCNALGLFADDGRLVVSRRSRRGRPPDVKEIAAYLKAPAPATTLALVGGELKKDSPIAKAVAGKGEVLLWDAPQKQLQRWVADQFKRQRHDRRAGGVPGAHRARRRRSLRARLARSTSSRRGRPASRVTAADVERLVAARAGTTNFALTDAWGAGT